MAANVGELLAQAEAARRAGQADAAARHMQAVLELEPENPQALNSLGVRAILAGDMRTGVDFLSRAVSADPNDLTLWLNLADAQRRVGDDVGERNSLTRLLSIDQLHIVGLIRMAELHERLGEDNEAHLFWVRFIQRVSGIQQRTPALEERLAHARAFVTAQAARLGPIVEEGLANARAGVQPEERRRFDAWVDRFLGKRRIYTNVCTGVHFPFLPAEEFFPRHHFPWLGQIEAKSDSILAELIRLLEDGASGFVPYVDTPPGTPEWSSLDHSLDWSAYFLWDNGKRIPDAHARCPATVAALEAAPLWHVPGQSPTAFFSLLRPRTRIPPHTGTTNSRTIIHLPLIVPDGCGFRVGGETRQWRFGEALAFDDTIEHEAWNDSDERRVVLIFDVLNPYLTDVEQTLLRAFYATAEATGVALTDDAL